VSTTSGGSRGEELEHWLLNYEDLEVDPDGRGAIGQGSFGRVYVGNYLESQVAIKVLTVEEGAGAGAGSQLALSKPMMATLQEVCAAAAAAAAADSPSRRDRSKQMTLPPPSRLGARVPAVAHPLVVPPPPPPHTHTCRLHRKPACWPPSATPTLCSSWVCAWSPRSS
jgi:hypothetical protein